MRLAGKERTWQTLGSKGFALDILLSEANTRGG